MPASSSLPEFFENRRTEGLAPALVVVAVDRAERWAPGLLDQARAAVLESWQKLGRDLPDLRAGPALGGPEGLYLPCAGLVEPGLTQLVRGLLAACRARRLEGDRGRPRRFTASLGLGHAAGRPGLTCESWMTLARDTGIPSIHGTVQGLSPDAAFAELERDLMKQVLEGSLVLKAHVGEVVRSPGLSAPPAAARPRRGRAAPRHPPAPGARRSRAGSGRRRSRLPAGSRAP
jgi:hypothetical protein